MHRNFKRRNYTGDATLLHGRRLGGALGEEISRRQNPRILGAKQPDVVCEKVSCQRGGREAEKDEEPFVSVGFFVLFGFFEQTHFFASERHCGFGGKVL